MGSPFKVPTLEKPAAIPVQARRAPWGLTLMVTNSTTNSERSTGLDGLRRRPPAPRLSTCAARRGPAGAVVATRAGGRGRCPSGLRRQAPPGACAVQPPGPARVFARPAAAGTGARRGAGCAMPGRRVSAPWAGPGRHPGTGAWSGSRVRRGRAGLLAP